MSILNNLIQQAKKPNGFIGRVMVSIMNSAHHKKTKWGLSKLEIFREATILDIGCGGGKTISLLTSIAAEGQIYGIDYSQEAVKQTIRKNSTAVNNGHVKVEYGSVLDIPYENDKFDFVTAVQTHYFWSNLKNSITEIYRVLNNNGKVMIVSEIYKMDYHMVNYKKSEQLFKLLEACDFKELKLYEDNGWICLCGRKLTI